MKNILVICYLFFTAALFAQEWQPSYAEALVVSKEQHKPILLVFAGSDWCAPCIKLDKDIWQSDVFRTYAKENYVLYKADFPRKKANRLPEAVAEQNNALAEKYNPNGHFPLVLLLDSNENVLGETGYLNRTPQAYITHLNSFVK
ncbi:Thioredoxin-related protein [Pricia antarctica]|uniref:Thioredoxin-related protein n=1 Tax=Pricia antarctica TaxID=641691 RepID=A0A1G6ZYF1_9FLAO|nr:thioredoxin family protein [Pricia antarctica]SDE07413.1 Thioredoxin-related protein [Pricia antarctica]